MQTGVQAPRRRQGDARRSRRDEAPRSRRPAAAQAPSEVLLAFVVVAALVVIAWPGVAMLGIVAVLALVVRVAARGARALWHRLQARSGQERGQAGRAATPPGPAARLITIAAFLALVPAVVSWIQMMSGPSNSSLGVRTVEWLRDNGGRTLVSDVENVYYSMTAPAKGGPALQRLPVVGLASGAPAPSPRAARAVHHAPPYRPPAIRPVIHPGLPGEGVWRPTQRRYAGRDAPVLVTTFRPDPSYPRVVAGVAWIDPRRARIALIPGLSEPLGGGTRIAEVAPGQRQSLLATFNSGFKHGDSAGGFYAAGRLYSPLVQGEGTILGMKNGTVDVRAWQGGPRPGPSVTFARQNLPLIVDHGQPNPNLSDGPQWGATLGNAVLVWRSGVGVDRHGHIIYAAANDQTVSGLAHILMRAGAVRAIELDINYYWVSLNTYGKTGARDPSKLLPGMDRDATRYLMPDDRDFFAVFAR